MTVLANIQRNCLTIRVAVNPVGWKAPTAYTKRASGRVFAATAPAPELVVYQAALRELSLEQYRQTGKGPITEPCEIDWVFRRQLPSYTSTAGRTVTKHRQDLTNLVKAAEDAIQPHIIANDSQVMAMTARFDVPQSKDIADPYVEFTIRWS